MKKIRGLGGDDYSEKLQELSEFQDDLMSIARRREEQAVELGLTVSDILSSNKSFSNKSSEKMIYLFSICLDRTFNTLFKRCKIFSDIIKSSTVKV